MSAAALALAVSLVLPLVGSTPAALADHAGVVAITFPVEGTTSYRDTFSAPRSGGRIHQATDIMAPKMRKVYAAMGGTVTWAPETQPSYGWMLSIRGDDGVTYHYVHLNNDTPGTDDGAGGIRHAYVDGVRRGVRVKRGQHIAWVGDSGNAEWVGSHLHFEMQRTSDGHMLNPYLSLKAAEAGAVPDEPAPPPQEPPDAYPFTDVHPDSTHADAIAALAATGITTGCGGTRYCPAPEVTRGQMASFVARALGLDTADPQMTAWVTRWKDMTTDHVHAGAIGVLSYRGIAPGCGAGRFCPDDPITRQDMAEWLAEGLGLEAAPGAAPPFDDVDPGDWRAESIAAIAAEGITTGCDRDSYCPEGHIPRAQMASFLVRAFLS